MPAFSKPVRSYEEDMPWPVRKRTLNPKLTSEDNVHEDAIKWRCTQEESSSVATTQLKPTKAAPTKKPTAWQPSIEDINNDEDIYFSNAGPPKKLNAILEAADGSDNNMDTEMDNVRINIDDHPDIFVDEPDNHDEEEEPDVLEEETDEKELGIYYC